MDQDDFALVAHGGAGKWRKDKQTRALEGLESAVRNGRDQLATGGTALDTAEQVVTDLENNPVFNAGTGSSLNLDGEIEMDASIMNGERRTAGAVAGLRDVKNPIQVARKVMTETDHVMLSGEGALRFARAMGFESHDCMTEQSQKTYEKKKKDIKSGERRYSFPNMPELLEKYPELEKGTVGAAVRDRDGRFAAATSTGGLILQLAGRVGDTPIPGAGTYATKSSAASATGQGELVMRMLSTRMICESIESGLSPQEAVEDCIAEMKQTVGADSGFIAVGPGCKIGLEHDSPHMPHAYCSRSDSTVSVGLETDNYTP
ncbi:MAG: isoaspartyl peptidase/L-asparaginase family protein [bacterium]